MRMPPLPADFTHTRVCKPFCEKYLTLPFGDRVRALRKERDITQAELASVLNVESHYISRIERGLSGCSIEIIIVLSKVLGVSIDYLVVGKEYSSVKEELERVINQLEKIRMDIV